MCSLVSSTAHHDGGSSRKGGRAGSSSKEIEEDGEIEENSCKGKKKAVALAGVLEPGKLAALCSIL